MSNSTRGCKGFGSILPIGISMTASAVSAELTGELGSNAPKPLPKALRLFDLGCALAMVAISLVRIRPRPVPRPAENFARQLDIALRALGAAVVLERWHPVARRFR